MDMHPHVYMHVHVMYLSIYSHPFIASLMFIHFIVICLSMTCHHEHHVHFQCIFNTSIIFIHADTLFCIVIMPSRFIAFIIQIEQHSFFTLAHRLVHILSLVISVMPESITFTMFIIMTMLSLTIEVLCKITA